MRRVPVDPVVRVAPGAVRLTVCCRNLEKRWETVQRMVWRNGSWAEVLSICEEGTCWTNRILLRFG